ncbi:MAG: 23S rRNA (guanosine(2251)-2'-O)-methyltransferase RlmB [Rhodothermales bacterium]|nr:23S rRNA (guanosine(2251)-2'-O)-methyltransferase RlmB [Rhodothermales bacterium]
MNETTRTVLIGRKPVKEALINQPRSIDKILLTKTSGWPEIDAIRAEASRNGVPVQYAPDVRLDKECGRANHQGVVAFVSGVDYRDLDDMLREVAPTRDDVTEKQPILLALDRVEDPHNLGAILRSALAAGVAGVVVPDQRMAPLNAAAMKASAGAAMRLPIARVTRLADALYLMKERGYWVVGADASGEATIWSYDWRRPVVIVVGSEGAGLHPSVLEQCDALVSIPLYGPMESLNVSVASALTVYAAAKQRHEA